ncbi:transcriptional regulator ATRX [Aplysia californica]|uniref:ATP-dependent helicase ATRX n=1 Tax=Aplysia californica TaxID=6500 RepID=A0ABM1A483_APLCA|nr:transcriptional regulator ATRX [Aplysia californica]
MASLFKSGSSRSKKGEAPGKLRIVMKGFSAKSKGNDKEEDSDNSEMEDVSDSGVPEHQPEGNVAVEPESGEDAPVKKKKEAPVRIDTSVLDNVSCTACGRQLNPYKGNALQKHPALKVVICKRCDKFLSSGDIAKDKDGIDEQCRWCGEGGRLVVCDECSSAFCKSCVMRNFNRSEFNNINGQSKWRCYLCDKAPLQGLRETYRNIRDTLKALQARDKAKAAAAAASGNAQPSSNGTKRTGKSNDAELSKSAVSTSSSSSSAKKNVQQDSKAKNSASSKEAADSKRGSASPDNDQDVALCASDLKTAPENVDVVMDKLSTATSTFKEMLRALRSQFHSTSPRADEEDATPMFHFSLSSSMSVTEKKRCCAKALNSSLHTYVKSLKAILTASDSKGQAQDSFNTKTGADSAEQSESATTTSEHQEDGEKSLTSASAKQQSNSAEKATAGRKTISRLPFTSSTSSKSRAENVSSKVSPVSMNGTDSDSRQDRVSSRSSEDLPNSAKKSGGRTRNRTGLDSLSDDSDDDSSKPKPKEKNQSSHKSVSSLQKGSTESESLKSITNERGSTRLSLSRTAGKEKESKDSSEKSVEKDKIESRKSREGKESGEKDKIDPKKSKEGKESGEKDKIDSRKSKEGKESGEKDKIDSRKSKEGKESGEKDKIDSKKSKEGKESGEKDKIDSKKSKEGKESGEKDKVDSKKFKEGKESGEEDKLESKKLKENKESEETGIEKDKMTTKKSKSKDVLEASGKPSETEKDSVPSGADTTELLCEDSWSENGVSSPHGEVASHKNDAGASCDNEDEENMAAKFDLIKELADEMLKSNEEAEEKEDGGDGEKEEEEEAVSDRSDNGEAEDEVASNSRSKRKFRDSDSSGEDKSRLKKTPKKAKKRSNSSEKSSKGEEKDDENDDARSDFEKVSDGSDSNQVKDKEKADEEQAKDSVAASDDEASSSDVLMSSDDNDVGTSTSARRKKKNKKELTASKEKVQKPAKETKKVSKVSKKPVANGTDKPKSAASSAVKSKPKSNGKASKGDSKNAKEDEEEDEDEKEIEKLSKMPVMRKRKVKDTPEEVEEDVSEVKSKTSKPPAKRNKPGPKCSKKNMDFEDLSSDGDDAKNDEIDEEEEEDDEDEPKVTFFLEEPVEQQDGLEVDEENEMAKNGLLDEMDSDKAEEDDKDSDDSSLDEFDEPQKSKKKDEKKTSSQNEEDDEKEENDDDDDSDSPVGRKKQIRSKLLDTKLSDSDSDIGKSKKKKKEEDETFKTGEEGSSSGSSIESDLPSEEESEKDSDEDGDNSEPKSKKKGKKKPRKRKGKKKKKGSDDDEEDEEQEDDDEEEEGGKKKKGKGKKRRRIKKIANSSDEDGEKGSDSDDDDPNSSQAGKRKKIRKVMSNKKLEDSTRAAARAEEKRRKRIAAKQREFNIETITDENNPMNCLITTKLILEPGKEEGDEPIVQVNKKLVRKLKPHQVEAVQFMWDCMYESVKRSKKEQGAGCILAHCMGLGKTLSVISFVHTVMTHAKVLGQRTCLVVSPLNTVLNWQNEWTMWFDEEDQLEVWELASCKQNPLRADTLKDWHESGGIMIIGYEMYRNLTTGARIKNKRQKKIFYETLVDPGPDLVVCDEGHILKNEASALSKAMNQMKTRRRVVLTGTPLQNNLNEYHCMVSFVKPNLLGTRKEFNNRFISPIGNGQCTDSTPRDVKLMKARAHVLHEMLAGCVQRRDYSALTKFLPPKQEYVISVRLTDVQADLYYKYMELSGQGVDGVFNNKGARLFKDYQNLMKIWTHPWVLKLAEIRDELKMKYDDEDSFIDDDSLDERSFSSSGSSSDDDKKMSDSGGEGTSAGAGQKRGTRRTRAKARRQAGEDSDPEEVITEWKSKTRGPDEDGRPEEPENQVSSQWWAQYVTEDDKSKLELSNKLTLLFEILRMCEEIGDKVLIFSQSILSLNIIENFLENIDSKFQQECDEKPEGEEEKPEEEMFGRQWTKNLDYYRMDGSTSAQNRQAWAQSFNDLENYRARLFLISTKAGGLGINLVAANRVIIFDASWNPSHDVQSIFRVYRFGQTKPCYIYRFLAQGSMEEKIYERQVTKLSLSQRVVDEHQIERHFSASDLKELYNFTPDRWNDGKDKPTLALPKDPLLAEILTNNKQCVVSFHEHDSLLENQIEQTLTEEEKKAAWEEYENEKKGIIVRGPGMERTASWPMMAAAQILSREQITATVQTLRQQLPDVPEELFQLHVQQALRRMVQLKQEEMRRIELMRIQEMNYLNMMKQEAQQQGLTHAQSLQALQNMQSMAAAPWMQIQRLRAMQNQMLQQGAGGSGMMNSAMMGNLMGAMGNQRLSNKPEEAIDLDAPSSK